MWGSSFQNSFGNHSNFKNMHTIGTYLMCPPVHDSVGGPICACNDSSQLFPLLSLCCLVSLSLVAGRGVLNHRGAGSLTFLALSACVHLLGGATWPQEGHVVVVELAWRRRVFSSPSWICCVTWGMSLHLFLRGDGKILVLGWSVIIGLYCKQGCDLTHF